MEECFLCKGVCKKDAKKGAQRIALSLVEKVLANAWGFPEGTFPQREEEGTSLDCCRKCIAKLRKVSKVHFQLQTLRNLLSQLQREIEDNLLQDFGTDGSIYFEEESGSNPEGELKKRFSQGLGKIREQLGNNETSMVDPSLLPHTRDRPPILPVISVSRRVQGVDVCENDVEVDKIMIILNEHLELDDDEALQMLDNTPGLDGEGILNCPSPSTDADFLTETSETPEGYHQTSTSSDPQLGDHKTPIICNYCGREFRMQKLLNFHIKNRHSESREFSCTEPNCPKAFITRSKLKAHLETHRKRTFACQSCSKSFSTQVSLTAHQVQHSDSAWRCSLCDKSFSCHSALKNHSSFHSNDFKFKCDICPYGGPSISALERHKVSHADTKLFRCDICSTEFKYKKSLQKHTKVHAGEKSFACSTCKKSFVDNYKLQRHLKIHSGVRSFSCSQDGCGRSFFTKDALNAHYKNHHLKAVEMVQTEKRSKQKRKTKPNLHRSSGLTSHETAITTLTSHNYPSRHDESLETPTEESHEDIDHAIEQMISASISEFSSH